jgi:hypothetical protein
MKPPTPLDGEHLGRGWIGRGTLALTPTKDPRPSGLLAWNTPTRGGAPALPTSTPSLQIIVRGTPPIDWKDAFFRFKPQGLTGGGRCCNDSALSDTAKVGSADYIVSKFPDVKLAGKDGAWAVNKVTAYTVIYVSEPLEGAYPELNKNVTTNPDDGVRTYNGKKNSKDPRGKGYYEEVAKNLELYKGADNKPYDQMYWWVRGSTLRHEQEHLRLYKEWFKDNLRGFLLRVSRALEAEVSNSQLKSVSRAALEKRARSLLKRALKTDPNYRNTHEVKASALTAREFKAEADKLRREAKKPGKGGGKR